MLQIFIISPKDHQLLSFFHHGLVSNLQYCYAGASWHHHWEWRDSVRHLLPQEPWGDPRAEHRRAARDGQPSQVCKPWDSVLRLSCGWSTALRYIKVRFLFSTCLKTKFFLKIFTNGFFKYLLRYFHRTTDFIHSAVRGGGLVVVNCYMGLSRSASCVLAYLMTKQDMSLNKVSRYHALYKIHSFYPRRWII